MQCPLCGSEYQNLGSHWHRSASCEYPELTDYQHEIVTGLLMGDGTLHMSDKSAGVKVECIEPEYLRYLEEQFEHYARNVWLSKSASESAKGAVESGLVDSANPNNYSDVWTFETRQTPKLDQYRSWYSSGSKVFPDDIRLTPTVLKHWFVGDGTFNSTNSNFYIYISSVNEEQNKEKVESYFEQTPISIDTWESYTGSTFMRFNKDNAERLFEYIGEPVPGYEYKWP